MMRLDKFLTNYTDLSRNSSVEAIRKGRVFVDGKCEKKNDIKIDEKNSTIQLDGNIIEFKKYIYLMLNKPSGILSATNDKTQKTVIDLLPQEYKKYDLFPCGRLDKDTIGLLILTNDGINAHRLLSPKNNIQKVYQFECSEILSNDNIVLLEAGIELKDGWKTKPCKINLRSSTSGTIAITEGKYHEIKRMFGAIGNKITFLQRLSFGEIKLDENLKCGEFRPLNDKEEVFLRGKYN